MIIVILPIIIVLLFFIWIFFAFYKLAFLALVNVVVGGVIILRMIHDIRSQRAVLLYVASAVLASGVILGIRPVALSEFLSKLLIIEVVQVLMLVFVFAQVLLFADKKKRQD